MLLSEIFDYLNYGEFSELYLGNREESGIDSDNYAEILSHLNLALIDLHKKFPLNLKQIDIQMYSSISDYYLREKYSVITGTEPTRYLLDSLDTPFSGSVNKIERITTSNTEIVGDMPLNDESVDNNIITFGFDRFRVSEPNDTDILTVTYRSSPERIPVANLDPDTEVIDLPDIFIEPILFFMAARAYMGKKGLENQPSQSLIYQQKYDASIMEIKNHGLVNYSENTNTKFERNGWR